MRMHAPMHYIKHFPCELQNNNRLFYYYTTIKGARERCTIDLGFREIEYEILSMLEAAKWLFVLEDYTLEIILLVFSVKCICG